MDTSKRPDQYTLLTDCTSGETRRYGVFIQEKAYGDDDLLFNYDVSHESSSFIITQGFFPTLEQKVSAPWVCDYCVLPPLHNGVVLVQIFGASLRGQQKLADGTTMAVVHVSKGCVREHAVLGEIAKNPGFAAYDWSHRDRRLNC